MADAISETKAIDMAEANPIKPGVELAFEFVPEPMATALLTVQDENYLETRNAARLLHTTVLPAAALVPNDGGGAREGVRRSDNDVEVEEQKQTDEMGKFGAGIGERGMFGKESRLRKLQPGTDFPGESRQTMRELGLEGQAPGAAVRKVGQLYGMVNPGAAREAAERAQDVLGDDWERTITSLVNNEPTAGERIANTMNIRDRMQAEGWHPDRWNEFIQEKRQTTEPTEFEEKGRRNVYDELRPFFPIAGSSDVELQPGDVEQKKRNAALFSNYKPPNWPLGNMDNQLYFQNLVLQGVQWMSPLDSVPPVLQGGTLYTGAHDFGSMPILPSNDVLLDLGVANQVEFRLGTSSKMVLRLRCFHAGAARTLFMTTDTKYIHNPMAEGVNSSMEEMRSDMNPLSTPLHADLQLGGSRELKPLMPECDAIAQIEQPGGGRGEKVDTSYMRDPLYNYFAIYPGAY